MNFSYSTRIPLVFQTMFLFFFDFRPRGFTVQTCSIKLENRKALQRTFTLFLVTLLSLYGLCAQTQLGTDIDGENMFDGSGVLSMSADGTRVAIGAQDNDGNGSSSGHVRVYEFNGAVWSQLGADINGEAASDYSGMSVSLSADGSTVAIGAFANDGNGENSGHVRVFRFDGTNWLQLGADLNGKARFHWFGLSLDISQDGNLIAIGAPQGGANSVGIYSFDGSTWSQLGADINYSGIGRHLSFSSDGSTVAVGAPYNSDSAYRSGQVRIYRLDASNNWVQIGSDIFGEAAEDFSGEALSLNADGSILAIGAKNNDGNGNDSGHVRVYGLDGGNNWLQLGADIDGEAAGDQSGFSVSLNSDGSILAIGAQLNDGNGSSSGHARIYKFDGSNNWSQVYSDFDGEAANDQSGFSVSLSADGSILAIGAKLNDGNGNNSGHVRVYSTKPTFSVSETALTITENAGTGTFSIVLDTQPTSNVVFDISSNDTAEASVSPAQLTFTNVNWNIPQSITITGIDDNDNGNDAAIITIAVNDASSDDAFDTIDNQTVNVTLTDEDDNLPVFTAPKLLEDLAGASNSSSFSLNQNTSTTRKLGLEFSADGTRMFSLGFDDNLITEYILSTPFDITTATFNFELDVTANGLYSMGLAFNDAGSKLYVYSGATRVIYAYDLSVAFDLSTATIGMDNLDVTSFGSVYVFGLDFNPDGTKLYIVNHDETVLQFQLSTPFLISSASSSGSIDLSSRFSQSIYGISFNSNGTQMYIGGYNDANYIIGYDLSVPYDITTATLQPNNGLVLAQPNRPTDIFFSTGRDKLFVLNYGQSQVYEYNLGVAPLKFEENATTPVVDADANDGDGGAADIGITYSLASGGDNDLFSIDGSMGVLTFQTPPDFENPQDADTDNIYEITIVATDSEGSTNHQVLIQVTDVNYAPSASSVSFSVNLTVGQTLMGSYNYADSDGDVESGTTYQWYRSDDGTGTNKAAISGATNDTYVLANDDLAKYISFEVTPSDGTDSGSPEESALNGPIAAPPSPPTVTSTSITSAIAQSLYYYDIKAADADNDLITWTANTVPAWLTFTSGILQTSFVGTGATPTNTGDGVNQSPDGTSASSAVIRTGTAAYGDNKLFYTDTEEYGIRYVDANGNVQTWYQGDGTFTNLNPVGVAYDAVDDAVYVGDYAKTDILKIDNTGTRTLLSNLPEPFMLRLLVNSTGSKLYASARGGIYEIDLTNNNPDTNWTRIVGTGTMGYSDTGTASTSQVSQPHGMAFDSAGRLVFTDRFNDIIRRVNLATDTIETIAGTQGTGTEAGDGGAAVNATFSDPSGLVINEQDEIFISERLSKRIRKIDTNGDIDTFFRVASGGFADDLVISDEGELYLLTTNLIAQVASKAELTGTPTNADAGTHDVALTLSDGTFNVPYNFQITVQALNAAPTDISLDNSSINQSATGVDSTVGTLFTTDSDSGDSHTYSLVAGTGDDDNASFNIDASSLRTNNSLSPGSYSVRINANDGTDDFAKAFTVTVIDDTAPGGYTATIDQDPIDSSNQTSISFTFALAEVGADYTYSFSSDGGGTNVTDTGAITSATDQITGIDLSGLADGLITLTVTLTDSSANEGTPVQDSATKDVDQDNDGISDANDNCPSIANTDQLDTDNDGDGDECDTDDDNDGTPDTEDAFPLDPNEDTDTDGDGTGDNADAFPNNLNEDKDTDGDGTGDNEDAFPNDPNEDMDTDGDGTGDNEDTDDDADGIPDTDDAFPLDPTEDTDTDGDGTGDNADTDDDNDGTPDTEDAFPLDPTEDMDTDGDGTGDIADAFPNDPNEDTDADGDGTGDNADAFPNDSNEDTDTDGDGIGNNTDEDDDNDGDTDEEEIANNTDPLDAASFLQAEVAEDEIPEPVEAILVPAEAFTPNGDGINDTWVVPGIDNHPNNTVRVYNRWGHEVFVAGNYQNDWTGRHNANSTLLPTGSYLYVIDLGNGTAPLQGWIFINY